MRACTTAGGGVMFIPDTIEAATKIEGQPKSQSSSQSSMSYSDLPGVTEAPMSALDRLEKLAKKIANYAKAA